MTNLHQRQEKIQQKRKQTSWEDFLRDVCSWFPIVMNRDHGVVSRYPKTKRIGGIHSGATETQGESEYLGDFHKTFGLLMRKTNFSPLLHWGNNENVDYSDVVLNAKHAYLSNAVVGDTQGVLYSWSVKHNCSDVISSVMVRNGSSQVYESHGVVNSTKIFYSTFVENCSDVWFSSDVKNCHHCIDCHGGENMKFCYKNRQLTQEEYKKIETKMSKVKNIYKRKKKTEIDMGLSKNGLGVFNSLDIHNGYFVNNVSSGKNLVLFGSNTDCEHIYDCITGGSPCGAHIYGGLSCSGEHIYCGAHCENCFNVYYSFDIEDCSYCLGCIGLKNKQFCIFNKQYSKEEWHKKVEEIFTQMEKKGIVGDFFPGSINPFYFNDTAAGLLGGFTKSDVTARDYLQRDEEVKVDIPEWMEVVETTDLGDYESQVDNKWTIDPIILKKVIRDEKGNSYRIIKMEYDFLQKHGLPLPRKHRLDRLKGHFNG